MTESKEQEPKGRLRLSRPGRLELQKTVEAGQVRQSFSHGRSKVVTVEVRKKRAFAPGAGGRMTRLTEAEEAHPEAEAEAGARPAIGLTSGEKAARVRALADAQRAREAPGVEAEHEALPEPAAAEEEARRQAEEEARRQAEEEERRRAEEERRRAEEERRRSEEEERRRSEEEADARLREVAAKSSRSLEELIEEAEEEEDRRRRRGGRSEARRPVPGRRVEPRRRTGKLTVTRALEEEERVRSLASVRRQREREKRQMRGEAGAGEAQKVVREVIVPETITVQELANRMATRGPELIKALMKMGVMATINQAVDADTAELVVAEFGHRAKRVSEADVEIGLGGEPGDDASRLEPRPPVVTVMGHVDHGKTSLLDALRETDVAAHEAGGITQHIGAYRVTTKNGQRITFIDTPGHEAFTAMRARGAGVTDIVVLVVAADDGIMPQTVEAIHHARAARVPIIVAINKIDKPGANPDRVRQELLKHEILVETMGGETLCVEVSALKRLNLDKLEEAILLQAEVLELRANPDRPASGAVIEAKLDAGRGPVATVLVQRGTLRVGDALVAGSEWGRVRALLDDRGHKVEEAGPSTPVEVLGLDGTPSAGDEFAVTGGEARAREVSEFRHRRVRIARAAATGRGTIEQMLGRIQAGGHKELAVVVKTDVQGSLEAIQGAIEKLGTDEVKLRVLHGGVGGINESDVTLAKASESLLIGFNVRANAQAREFAKRDRVDIRYYSIIYDLVDDLKKVLSGLLAPTMREHFLGNAEIRQVFSITKVGKVAGCMVTEGVVKRGAKVRLLRDNVVIHQGSLSSLKRHKDDAREVREGFECGMAFENYNNIEVGDVIECYEIEEVERAL
ncbi:MAG: translation initiation factor IF-2 [Proteobacteria bacterium]|nr:translation initiation factor IF-2 [Pseudomonadota bacterium]